MNNANREDRAAEMAALAATAAAAAETAALAIKAEKTTADRRPTAETSLGSHHHVDAKPLAAEAAAAARRHEEQHSRGEKNGEEKRPMLGLGAGVVSTRRPLPGPRPRQARE